MEGKYKKDKNEPSKCKNLGWIHPLVNYPGNFSSHKNKG